MFRTDLLEAEILGSIFLDQTLMDEAVDVLNVEMFTQPRHRALFKVILDCKKKGHPINLTTLATVYEKYLDRIGGISYVSQIISSVASTATFRENVKQLVEANARIKLMQLLEETKRLIEDPSAGEFEEILDRFEQKSLAIRPRMFREQSPVEDIIEWYEKLVEKMQDKSKAFGLMTGWNDLDRMTLGWQRSDLIVVGARTSMGKSAFAIENALRISKNGYKVAIFSLEMDKKQIYSRMMANLAGISMQTLRIGNVNEYELQRISEHMEEIAKIHIDDTRIVTAEYISSEMRRLKRNGGLDFVIVDYLQEIKEPYERNDNSGSALHRICQKIRAAAKECDCAVMGLSQVKRDVETRSNKRPMPSDLLGSTAIEAVADVLILLYRDEYYHPDTEEKGLIEVNLAKQRNGPIGTVKLKYDKDFQRITG